MIWECTDCYEQYIAPGRCDGCSDDRRAVFSPEDTAQVGAIAEAINKQIERVCDLLDYRMDYYTLEDGEVEVYARWAACTRGCCGSETSYHTFPHSYLCMSDDDIKATEEGKKAEAERVRVKREAEALKKRELATARARAESARIKARTAERDAARELATAERELAKVEATIGGA